ncbi:MAG: hypothetical protein PHP93_02150 [Kiritimatiellales bacterium]|nr:hypothetical protein [Kiritimatiellales bacterium]
MKKLWISLATLLIAGGAMAVTRPFNASITPNVAVYDRTDRIEGLTLSIWGENEQTSLALGIVNGTTGNSAGLSWGYILNYAENYKGIQWAPINYVTGDFLGWQGALVNYTGGSMKGLQTGVVNCAGLLTGLQLGLVNYAQDGQTGVQIGLVNLIPSNQWFSGLPDELAPGMIFVNWCF